MRVGILRFLRGLAAWTAVIILLGAVGPRPSPAAGLTPDSPEVKAAIGKAVKFLESDAANDERLGARALVGLVLLKDGAKAEHPKIAQAVTAIQGAVGKRNAAELKIDIYSSGLSIIFLTTLNASKYRAEIDCLLESLRLRQKPHGGWGYPEKETGDTSMTQYGVLSMWEAAQVGCTVPRESVEAVTIWLLKTQDPSGAFGYQGTISPTFAPVKQSGTRHSMAAAGLGSVYICADLLGQTPRADKRDDDLPPALKEVKPQPPDAPEAKQPPTQVDPRVLRAVQGRGNAWMRANYSVSPKDWTHYFLYALERYQSFRELAAGKPEKEPKWYSDGARYLIRTQSLDGSWVGQGKATADTAFATLFLLRSTKKSIERSRTFGEGTLLVGFGLPPFADQIVVRRGSVVGVPRWKSAKEVRAALAGPPGGDYDQAIAALAELSPQEAETLAAQDAALLRRLTADRLPQVRIAAVRVMGNARHLDSVPALIAALDDPDAAVVRAVHDALRRISRRLSAPDLPQQPTHAQRRAAVEEWKQWYLAVRPEGEL
jgi:hypothetical protein